MLVVCYSVFYCGVALKRLSFWLFELQCVIVAAICSSSSGGGVRRVEAATGY